MKIATTDAIVVQHLPASAVRDAAACTWDGFVTNVSVAVDAGATLAGTRSANTRAVDGTAVVPTSGKRTAPSLIRDSSPPA